MNIAQERLAWGAEPAGPGEPLLTECAVSPGGKPVRRPGGFDTAFSQPDAWQFVHIAAHGGGKGLGQYLRIPGEPLSAVRALALNWPTSVLMASCHVGLVVNENGAEPLNFVMALLTGGARCVVAGIDSVDDEVTGSMAAHMVRAVRAGGVSLDVALRNAQLAVIEEPVDRWALLSAYVR